MLKKNTHEIVLFLHAFYTEFNSGLMINYEYANFLLIYMQLTIFPSVLYNDMNGVFFALVNVSDKTMTAT